MSRNDVAPRTTLTLALRFSSVGAGMTRLAPWLLAVVTALAACSAKPKMMPAGDLWTTANEAYDIEAYELAIERYKMLLDQYPFSENAEEAELRIGYAYFLAGRYDEAMAERDGDDEG